jgi:transposase-like protein
MRCVRCGNVATRRDGQTRLGGQRWRCDACRRRFTARSASAFSGRRFPDDVIAVAVRWYARFRLSYADVAEWLAERGFPADRSAISRWVQRFLPPFGAAAQKHRRRVGKRPTEVGFANSIVPRLYPEPAPAATFHVPRAPGLCAARGPGGRSSAS